MDRTQSARQTLDELLDDRILVLDGGLATLLQQSDLTAADYGGALLEGCHEQLNRTRPDIVLDIHRAYLRAGADIIATNSFGGTRLVLSEYGLDADAAALNIQAARIAREAVDKEATAGRPRFVAGAMGPTNRTLSVTRGLGFAALSDHFYDQAAALVEGGVDLLLLETCHDTLNVKAALLAIDRLGHTLGWRIPVMASATLETGGTMLAGQGIDAFCASIAHADLVSIGVNCSTGPELMADHIRTLSAMAPTRVSCHPNAGLPDEEGVYPATPDSFASQLEIFADRGWLNIVGGCCGTTDRHIAALARMVHGKRPRPKPSQARRRTYYSGVDLVEADDCARPLIVGERANVIGSRQFRNLVATERWDEAAEVAREQTRHGAQIIDVCLQSADRDELADIPRFYERLMAKTRAPIMIDSTDPAAVELALTYCQGKSIVNSINLEDGEAKFERMTPTLRRHGAAVVVGCIDDRRQQSQALTRERKLEVAERACRLLTNTHGIAPEDIIIDPLVFPCATGDAAYIGAAVETIEALSLLKTRLPRVKTALGISNVSFGLPTAARHVVNAVFLHHCTKAGLDLAIVNPAALERLASIPLEERQLAEALLFNAPPVNAADGALADAPADWRRQSADERQAIAQHHIAALTEYFRETRTRSRPDEAALTLAARIARHVVDGSRNGLTTVLDQQLAEGVPALDIVNGPLMAGMTEVGRLFNANEMIVAEVLQSAEVMKAAVMHLEPFMGRAADRHRSTILLATVKGDVHDIGKDLVGTILANNGYEVVDLGTKVSPEVLVAACRERRPDAIGLSGLLVKSAQQMIATAEELKLAGIDVPLLVGGAALSEKFTRSRIAPAYAGPVCYAGDAMAGLTLMNRITARGNEAARESLLERTDPAESHQQLALPAGNAATAVLTDVGTAVTAAETPVVRRSNRVGTPLAIPCPPDVVRHVETVPLAEVWNYLNPFMLFGRHLGYKGQIEKALEAGEPKAVDLAARVRALQGEATSFMTVKAVWQFFEAERDGNAVHLFEPRGRSPVHTFRFDRQRKAGGVCLSDYVLDPQDGGRDHVALFVATAGAGVREHAARWKEAGELFKAHAVQALAVESAEACAEWLHQRIRQAWGFPDPPSTRLGDLLTAKYRGKRYSFGYPACPNLDDQQGIWKLLGPEEIGVQLTDGMMMDPEASVSGIIFHHPDCAYFAVSDRG